MRSRLSYWLFRNVGDLCALRCYQTPFALLHNEHMGVAAAGSKRCASKPPFHPGATRDDGSRLIEAHEIVRRLNRFESDCPELITASREDFVISDPLITSIRMKSSAKTWSRAGRLASMSEAKK